MVFEMLNEIQQSRFAENMEIRVFCLVSWSVYNTVFFFSCLFWIDGCHFYNTFIFSVFGLMDVIFTTLSFVFFYVWIDGCNFYNTVFFFFLMFGLMDVIFVYMSLECD